MSPRLNLSDSRLLLVFPWIGFVSFNTSRVMGGLREPVELWGSTYAWVRIPGRRIAQVSLAHPEGFEFATFPDDNLS